jgi:fatty-acyl-CoA synthase
LDLPTIRALLRARADDDHPALRFEDATWSWRDHVQASLDRAALLLALRREPFHVGVLLDNVPEFSFLLGAAAFAGAAVVGINPTRRGAELARDIRHTACSVIVTETKHRPLLEGLDHGVPSERVFVIDTPEWQQAVAAYAGSPDPDVESSRPARRGSRRRPSAPRRGSPTLLRRCRAPGASHGTTSAIRRCRSSTRTS